MAGNVSLAVNASAEAVKEAIKNNGEVLKNLPPEIVANIASLLLILKAAGILLIFYILFLAVKGILDLIRNRRIKKIYEKIYEIDGKMDLLLKNSQKKRKK
jgi:hypothetical protein